MNILDSLLIKELRKKDAQSTIENIMRIREKVSPILGRISTFFTDYTNHDISHCDQVVLNLDWIIPKKVINSLNRYEIQILLLACYLHDVGMALGKSEAEEIARTGDFQLYKKQEAVKDKDKSEEELLRDYIRLMHHRRSETYIIDNYKELGIENYVIARAVAILARGHREEDLLDGEKFDSRYYVVSGKDPVCLSFLSGCLRLADDLDITRVRTPELLLKFVSPRRPVSKNEWERHRNTLAIGADGNKIKIQAVCDDPTIHRSILLTADKIKDTLDLVRKVVINLPLDLRDKYFIELDGVMEPKIEEVGYLYRNFRFDFDTAAISKMLMGERLYRSKYDSCRELLQNSIDTCRLKAKIKANWQPLIRIGISKDKKILWVEDNGMGMDEFIIENYLLKVGRSYYRSTDFEYQYPEVKMNAISEFGIGILACFMIADSFVIESYMDGGKALRLEIGDIGENVVVRPSSRHDAGTRIELNLKPMVAEELTDMKLVEIVRHYVRHVEIPIKVAGSDARETEVLDTGYDFKLTEVMEPFKLDKISDYELVETLIDPVKSGGIKGKIGTILRKTSDGSLAPVHWAWRDFKSVFGSFGINVSQKGILVAKNIGRRAWYSEGWYGELNVEQSDELELRVSRDSFVLSRSKNIIDTVIQSGISELLGELFEKKWRNLEKGEICKITHQIIEGYVSMSGTVREPLYMTTEMRQKIMKNFMFRVVQDGKVGYSTLYDFLESIGSWILVPLSLDIEEAVILEEAEAIEKECGNSNLLLAGSQVAPKGAFEFLIEFLGGTYYWRITTSPSNRRSYYEYIRDREPAGEDSFAIVDYFMSLADFANENQLIGTYIGLRRFMNREHRFIRKLMSIISSIESVDLELVRSFFNEVGECLNTVSGKVSKEDLQGLINNQRILLNMFEERKFVSRQEKEELVLRKEELPEWRYESEAGSSSLWLS
jgi:hypothetical protein